MSSIYGSVSIDRSTSFLNATGSISLDYYIDPVTHHNRSNYFYAVTLDDKTVVSGVKAGFVDLTNVVVQYVSEGFHRLTVSASNSASGDSTRYVGDIHNHVFADAGLAIYGRDERPKSVAVDIAYGSAFDDVFKLGRNDDFADGGDGNDVIDGGSGNDWMEGGNGDDTYFVDSDHDTIVEKQSGGNDTVRAAVSWTLGDNLENLVLGGVGSMTGIGNNLANFLVGNGADNYLYGLDDKDALYGNGGADRLFGGSGNDRLYGGNGNDQLDGGEGSDLLDGGLGSDVMAGGNGNDRYVVDNARDTVHEAANGGIDTVRSSVTFQLSDTIENLTLTGTAAASGFGSAVANVLIGNDAANVLLGKDGNDTLFGLGGNDQLIGGNGNDRLDGGTGEDLLDGGAGVDRMVGGAGNDHYVVDTMGDRVLEAAWGGIDSVVSSVSYTLSGHVENLQLIAGGAVDGTGNGEANIIVGGAGANVLSGGGGNDILRGKAGDDRILGGAGNDTLDGGLGLDTLIGGAGSDVFHFAKVSDSPFGSATADRIQDFTGADMIDLSFIDANSQIAGNQAFTLDTDGIHTAGEIFQQKAGGMVILQFNTDSDQTPDMMIMLTSHSSFLTADDFYL